MIERRRQPERSASTDRRELGLRFRGRIGFDELESLIRNRSGILLNLLQNPAQSHVILGRNARRLGRELRGGGGGWRLGMSRKRTKRERSEGERCVDGEGGG